MDETCRKLSCDMLTAEELLRSKGIRNNVLEQWERSMQILPGSGKKHFEPNNSWLQNTQIDKSLKNRRDLLNIERVDRISELARAEWIPLEKKALVTKKSGQDWNKFGLERNGFLYLLPEEALFLLETNCLELTWNGVPFSIQQAYEILIDDSVCTFEEYRVYSQLTRFGYRIQRYVYEESEKCKNRIDEPAPIKRKFIVDSENGPRMSEDLSQNEQITRKSRDTSLKNVRETLDKSSNSNTKSHQNTTTEHSVEQIVRHIIDDILSNIGKNLKKPITAESKQKNINTEKRTRNNKVEIISDETLLGSIKILKNTTSDNTRKETSTISKRLDSPVQCNSNVSKRNDKIQSAEIPITHSTLLDDSFKLSNSQKRKALVQNDEILSIKKPKHEVIELSDDEIQILPCPMTTMEMLNLIPNIASQPVIVTKIPKCYIPHNIKPQKSTYEYSLSRILNMQENDKRMRENSKNIRNNTKQNTPRSNTVSSCNSVIDNRIVPFHNPNARSLSFGLPRLFCHMMNQVEGRNVNFPYGYSCNNRFDFNYRQSTYAQNRITLMQQNIFHDLFVAFDNAIQRRSFTIQMNNIAMPIIEGYQSPAKNQFRQDLHQNFSWHQRKTEIMHPNIRRHEENPNSSSDNQIIINQPSFTTRPGTNSWAELKRKWCEEKTITIDDEDYKNTTDNNEECNETRIVKSIDPLVGPKNASSLTEVFSRLAIIKPASEKVFRRKKNRYKISYNIYSCTQHYRKAKPGQPLYSLVVIRKENSFIQPVELNRLQQDAKGSQIIIAYVSMSISYIQPDLIITSNIT